MKKSLQQRELTLLYHSLLQCYGNQYWWPAEEPFEVIIGAILTQSTNWQNVEKALANLKKTGTLNCKSLSELPDNQIATLIRPAGYFNAKALKLKAFCTWSNDNYEGDLNKLFSLDIPTLRGELLSIFGIGEETADSIILYAAGKPIFVVDTYTKRILQRLELRPINDSYRECQAYFMANLPPNTALFNEFHALFVRHGKEVCRKSPRCLRCCLAKRCPAAVI